MRLTTYGKHAAKGFRAMLDVEAYLAGSELPARILHLVKLRVSQINGCGYCVDMHGTEATSSGETPARLNAIAAWHDTPFFADDERAALALAEAATRIADGGRVEDDVWAEAARHFDDARLAALVTAIASINSWNRVNVVLQNAPAAR
ncbi:carboxymuconolactone decarboxylase family protein [Phytomonospora endophytica]|uniref:AhpD family alkylhydroperoxidase n=1 Tax=Phytomonospora endophytica TaxID=714109 RepID=A0A841FQY7_9ACTN|nr:carboxymuconolactone decarboxylase family protein [Phytomonospora endophytica]MBB6034969.1 AhpD family alkylhydroperoxidase [Phytomonospora endophytica]GIG70671.1 alkyl hydroperoxide reductase AhpD [Phytomonospora endophytica]